MDHPTHPPVTTTVTESEPVAEAVAASIWYEPLAQAINELLAAAARRPAA